MKATARHLIGRKIIAVDFRRFWAGEGKWATNPVLTLDNGRRVWFTTEETEVSEYGVAIAVSDRPVNNRPAKRAAKKEIR